jgi:hypothetical protein
MTMTASGGGTVVCDLGRGYVKAGKTTIEIGSRPHAGEDARADLDDRARVELRSSRAG